MSELTAMLTAASNGDSQAVKQVLSLMYGELHRLAHAKLRHHEPITLLDTTALLHEFYLRLLRSGELHVTDRVHFFAYAARVMRSIIVDFARMRLADRRGGGAADITLNTETAEARAPMKRVSSRNGTGSRWGLPKFVQPCHLSGNHFVFVVIVRKSASSSTWLEEGFRL